jgi:hypothetical protein
LPGTGELLRGSANLGQKIAELLDPELPVVGVTSGTVRPELKTVAVASRVDGTGLGSVERDLAITAGWGHAGRGDIVMPGKGRLTIRPYEAEELAAMVMGADALDLSPERLLGLWGEMAVDVYLNDVAYWRNVPSRVWEYSIGGYQVIKKWLSYREKDLLGRSLKVEEVREVTAIARRIAALLLLQPALQENYNVVKATAWTWG